MNAKRTAKEQLQFILLWLLFFWVSALCALLIDLLVTRIVTSIVVIAFDVEAIVHVVTYLIGTAIPIAAISYLISYHLADFSPLDSTAEGLGALVLHLLVGLLLGFPTWVTGGVRWLAGLLEYGGRLYGVDQLGDVALTWYLVAFVLFAVLLMVVKTVSGIVGKNLRIRSRIALTGSAKAPSDRPAETEGEV